MPPSILQRSLEAISGLEEFLDDLGDAEAVRLPDFPTAEDLAVVTGQADRDWRTQQLVTRLSARAALRDRIAVAVVRMEAEAYLDWLGGRPNAPEARREYLETRTAVLEGTAALRALGLPPEAAAPLKKLRPAVGGSIAARLARWAMRPDAGTDEVEGLAEELLAKRQDGAVGILQAMLEPEDFAFVMREIDEVAAEARVATEHGLLSGYAFILPASRVGEGELPPVPPELAGRLEGIVLADVFEHIRLAPYWIATEAILRLTPSQVRDVARAVAMGERPLLDPAPATATEIALLGVAAAREGRGAPEEEQSEEAFDAAVVAWSRAVEEATGVATEPPAFLDRARDILRRVELAVPDEGEAVEDDDLEVDEAAVIALEDYVAAAGNGLAIVAFEDAPDMVFRIEDGEVSNDDDAFLDEALEEALLTGGALLVFQRKGEAGLLLSGYRLAANVVSPMPAAEAKAWLEDLQEQPATGSVDAVDAPALEYDPQH